MPTENNSEFRRVLGPWSAGAIVAGSMIGTGIFLFVSDVALYCHTPGAILLAWALGGVIAGCGAMSLSELAATYPKTGGIYVYLHLAFGPLVSFLYAWAKFLIMRIGSFCIPALFFAGLFCDFWELPAESVKLPVAVVVIILITAVNASGVRAGGNLQTFLTGIKIFSLLGIAGAGAAFAAGLLASHPAAHITPVQEPGGFRLVSLGIALVPVMWTYGGWDESPFVAEEVRTPSRTLPQSILGGLTLVTLLFVLVNLAYLAVLSPSEIAGSEGSTVVWVMDRAVGPGAGKLLSLALMISTFGIANGLALTGARIVYAAGRDQAVFKWFNRTHRHTRTPVRALTVQALLAVSVIIFMRNPMALLLYTGLAYWVFSCLMALSVFVLRRREPELHRPFTAWGYPITPALFLIASLVMVLSILIRSPGYAVATVVILLAGAAVFVLQRRVLS